MKEFRTFRNADPPDVLRLWNESQLGRGAARPVSVEAFEQAVFSQPYFDPQGFWLACQGKSLVGMAHAGFAPRPGSSELDREQGIICAVVVHPEHRRQGVGRELVRRVSSYLRERGAVHIQAGEARDQDPFYFGIYGGCRPSGFLKTDPAAGPFFLSLGFEPREEHVVYQRDLRLTRDPVSFRTMRLRRITQVGFSDQPGNACFWWYARHGRNDSLCSTLTTREGVQVASVTVVGLDHYVPSWNERAIGLVDLEVAPQYRGQGYGQTLIVEVLRRLKQEMITRAELHVPREHAVGHHIAVATGFEAVDVGIVYQLPEGLGLEEA